MEGEDDERGDEGDGDTQISITLRCQRAASSMLSDNSYSSASEA